MQHWSKTFEDRAADLIADGRMHDAGAERLTSDSTNRDAPEGKERHGGPSDIDGRLVHSFGDPGGECSTAPSN